MPGSTSDQVYTYPAKRWRKKRRSYLITYSQSPKKKEIGTAEGESENLQMPSESSNPAIQMMNEDSKDSASLLAPPSTKDEASKVCL